MPNPQEPVQPKSIQIIHQLREPFAGFFMTTSELMTTRLKNQKIQLLLLRIGLALLIAYLVLMIASCLLSVLLPLFGIGIFGVLIQQLIQQLRTISSY
jgi:uncharacterized membrane protein YqjE